MAKDTNAATAATKPARKKAARNKPGPKPGARAAAAAAAANGGAAPAAAPAAKPGAYEFDLRQAVTITASQEKGTVRARAEWATGNTSYFVAYTSATGEYRENWIDEELLTGFVERRKRPAKPAAAAPA